MEKSEVNKIIAQFMGYGIDEFGAITSGSFPKIPLVRVSDLKYNTSFDWLMPVHRKVTDIGLWMMTNGYDKLWLEKSKEIEYAILNEETPEKAAVLISQLVKWYNLTNNK